jgi:hypothetical protein
LIDRHDVHGAEAAATELRVLQLAERAAILAGGQHVSDTHGLAETRFIARNDAFGQSNHVLDIEIELHRPALADGARHPVMQLEPHRKHGRWCNLPTGDLAGDLRVPVERVTVLHRGAHVVDVPDFDRELCLFHVVRLADQVAHHDGQITCDVCHLSLLLTMSAAHSITPR